MPYLRVRVPFSVSAPAWLPADSTDVVPTPRETRLELSRLRKCLCFRVTGYLHVHVLQCDLTRLLNHEELLYLIQAFEQIDANRGEYDRCLQVKSIRRV